MCGLSRYRVGVRVGVVILVLKLCGDVCVIGVDFGVGCCGFVYIGSLLRMGG